MHGSKILSPIQLGCSGDVPPECIANVVGHDETMLYERPSEAAPHATAIKAGLRASGDQSLEPDQQHKKLNLIRNCVNSIFKALHGKELEEEIL